MSDRQRQQRISEGARIVQTQPIPTDTAQGAAFRRIPAIIRSLPNGPGESFQIRWQPVRYLDTPPQLGRYEVDGDPRTGYPMEFLDRSAYAGMIVSGEPTAGSPLVFAYHRGGVWIIEPVGGGSSASRCIVASAPSNEAQFITVVRLKRVLVGETYVLRPAILDGVGNVVLSQVQCWDNTDSAYWTNFVVTGYTPASIPATAPVQLLVLIDGIEYIVPTWADATEPATGPAVRGVC